MRLCSGNLPLFERPGKLNIGVKILLDLYIYIYTLYGICRISFLLRSRAALCRIHIFGIEEKFSNRRSIVRMRIRTLLVRSIVVVSRRGSGGHVRHRYLDGEHVVLPLRTALFIRAVTSPRAMFNSLKRSSAGDVQIVFPMARAVIDRTLA
jgi:hypothetical protein